MVNIYSSVEAVPLNGLTCENNPTHHGIFPITAQLTNIHLFKRLEYNYNYNQNLIVDVIIYYLLIHILRELWINLNQQLKLK
jgi:hypothetical protein